MSVGITSASLCQLQTEVINFLTEKCASLITKLPQIRRKLKQIQGALIITIHEMGSQTAGMVR